MDLLKNSIDLVSNDSSILFVTAYKDIGRSNWNNYNRTNEKYFECFIKLTKKRIKYYDIKSL